MRVRALQEIKGVFVMTRGFVRLVHNGMDVSFHETVESALRAIEKHMSRATVGNTKIVDSTITVQNDRVDFATHARIIIYQYDTLYMETFVIKEV